MGLGETQVFQDEKSRLANTTVARIVAAKGSLNDPARTSTPYFPGDLPARGRARLAPARPRAEHGPGDDGDRARGRRYRLGVLTEPIRHRRDTSHAGPGGQFVVPLPAPPPPRGPLYPYMAPGHGG